MKILFGYRVVGILFTSVLISSCGAQAHGPVAAVRPLSPAQIMAQPAAAKFHDAHMTVNARFTSSTAAMEFAGDGVLITKPKPAVVLKLHVAGAAGANPVEAELAAVGSQTYQRTPAGLWQALPGGGGIQIPWVNARNASLVGQDATAQGAAWHLKASGSDGNPFDIWVRKLDGYPLRVVIGGADRAVTLTFDHFDAGAPVQLPADLPGGSQ